MKKKYLSAIFILISVFLFAQEKKYYYYYKGNKIFMELDKSSLSITTFENIELNDFNNLDLKELKFKNDVSQTKKSRIKYAHLKLSSTLNDKEYLNKISEIRKINGIRTVYPNFIGKNNQKIEMSDFLYVKLRNPEDLLILEEEASKYDLEIIEQNQFMPLWYTLRCTGQTVGHTLNVANTLFETNLFVSAVPDLMTDDQLSCANDTNFADLWGLENSTNPSIDINVCNAWQITEGSGVNVAVLDQGIELTHDDLASNISSLSYNTETNSSPSQIFGDHGTHCAGTIGAIKDNNFQVVGVAPQSTLFSISNSLASTPNSRIKRADGINWAIQNGVDIISNSWSSGIHYEVIDDAIENALTNGRNGLGTIMVFAAGNGSGSPVSYPANANEDILAVGSITSNGSKSSFSNIGQELDIVAPGSAILSTTLNDGITTKNGTSMATPHVAGVAALLLSVNPCLSVYQVNNIIEQTAQKVGGYNYTNNPDRINGTWVNVMGYGLVDAYAAVQMAQQMNSSNLDLYVKDSEDDLGIEPNTVIGNMWKSTDIWIRNSNDNGLEHQNPEFKANGMPNYILVRITNKSCQTSSGNEELVVHWAKANTALGWPQFWNGTMTNPGGYVMGDELASVNIPVLEPGEETIVSLPWVVPNPINYSDNSNPWHFCLLARIDSSNDPNSYPFTSNPNYMVRNNNNLAWKNLTIVDLETETAPLVIGGMVGISNFFDSTRSNRLTFSVDKTQINRSLFEEAEITVTLDDKLLEAWNNGGRESSHLSETSEENKFIITDDDATLDNLILSPGIIASLSLTFNFLTEEVTDQMQYTYDVIQTDLESDEIVGGETYEIRKGNRDLFYADAGNDKAVDVNENISISAADIQEPATYNWYDSQGNLIYQGKDMNVSADVAQKYKLEIIALSDGYKDYDEIEVSLNPDRLEVISPNPLHSGNVSISYKINQTDSAYLMLMDYYNANISNNYILDVNASQISINMSSYTQGTYTISLICDGEIVDTKLLIKE